MAIKSNITPIVTMSSATVNPARLSLRQGNQCVEFFIHGFTGAKNMPRAKSGAEVKNRKEGSALLGN